MLSSSLSQSGAVLCTAAGLLAGLLLFSTPPAQAQTRGQAPEQQHRSPSQTGNPAGTGVPDYAEPANPSSSPSQSPSGTAAPGASAQTNDPGTPNDPNQVPLGGAEWLAAAGAAYALNRLRKEGDDEDDE